jgi:acetolactate synthase-1/2/3 large subunit
MDAMMDSIPMLVVTGQVPLAVMGTDAFQELDTI